MKDHMMVPSNGGQSSTKAPYAKTSDPKGKLAIGGDLRQRPTGGGTAKHRTSKKR
jgi:hypothetical protein